MVKYKCNDCGKTFKGDYSTKACPNCKSENISEVTSLFANKTNRILFWAIIVVAVITGVALFFFLRPNVVEAELIENETSITIAVSGVDVDDLRNLYQVQVYTEQGESHDVLFFDNTCTVVYDKNHLMPGSCYTFELEKIGGGAIDNLVYPVETRKICLPEAIVVEIPEIVSVSEGKPNKKTKTYDDVTIVMNKPGNYKYIVENSAKKVSVEQETNVFNKLVPGDYVVKVVDQNGVEASGQFSLPEIKNEPPVTIAVAQETFDKLHKHQISFSKARFKLALGEVKLARSIDNYNKLSDVLHATELYDDEYKVVSFDVDEASGKIKSGTLVLMKK